jgi:hypothetical protein
MSFRQYGGINYAARNNIVKNNYTNANNLSVMTKVGQPDSIINVDSGLYGLGGDITFKFLDQPFYGIVFSDGTTQTTAKFIDSTNYWQPIPGDTSPTPVIYYSNTVLCGVNPSPSTFPVIGSGVKLATNGNVSLNGKLNVGYISGTTGFSTFSVEGTTGNTSIFGTLGIGTTTPSKKLEVFGDDALINGLTIGRGSGQQNSNTAIGDRALLSNVQDNFFLSNGASNTAVGSISLYTNTEGSSNTAVGVQSLFYNLTGSSNTAVGLQSLYYNSTGFNNTAFGNLSLFNSRGSNNTGQGLAAGYTNTSGSNNTYIGYQADCSGNNFSNSTALGANAKVTKSNQIVLGGNNSGYPDVYVPGNVGIGTTTPSKKLDVAGSDALINGLTIGFGGGNVSNNTTLGVSALSLNTTGVGNSAIGFQSLRDNGVGQWNTALGYSSSRNNTSGSENTALGFNALLSNYTGSFNTAVGRGALESNSTNDNTAVGYYSLNSNTTGEYNVAVGYHTLLINTIGYSNTAIGFNSLRNTTGPKNTGIGYSSLINTTGEQNTSIGYDSGKTNVSGNNNTFLGFGADCSGNNFSNSTAIGCNAKVTTNNQIVLGGNNGGYPVVYVPGNVGIGTTTPSKKLEVSGSDALINGLTIGKGTNSINSNTAFGYRTLYNNSTIGDNNTAVGYYTLSSNTGGFQNTALGTYSLFNNIQGTENTAVGANSLYNNKNGEGNVAIGTSSLFENLNSNNTTVGFEALTQNTSGDGNVAIGRLAGGTDLNGSYNTYIGYLSDHTNASTINYSTAIGANALITTSNQIVLGGLNGGIYPAVSVPGTLTVTGNTSLGGIPTAPTADAGTNTTQIATTAFVMSAISGSGGSGTNILLPPGTAFTPSSNVLQTLASQSLDAGTWSITYSFAFNIDSSVVGQYAQCFLSNTTSPTFLEKYAVANQTIIWANNTNSGGILAIQNGSTTLILTATTTIYFLGKVVYLGGGANLGAVFSNGMSFTRIG